MQQQPGFEQQQQSSEFVKAPEQAETGSMQRTVALNVVKAASRLKVLARNAREAYEREQQEAGALLASAAEQGQYSPGTLGPGVLMSGACSDVDGVPSLQGGSPLSPSGFTLPSRPLTPLDGSLLSFRSGARSIRSNCTGIHHKVPLLPWYKRDIFAVK